ncbi:MAG: NUDIX hydrolase [archaeon]|nr:NUDIX hydrolase [archaeon]
MTKYKNPAATATVIIERENKILLIRRKREPYRGMFALPGGFLNCGQEILERTAQRELYEETRLRVRQKDLYLLCVNSSPIRDPRGHVIDHVYVARNARGNARADDDASALEWIDAERVPIRLAFDHGVDVERYRLWRGENEIC